MTDIYRYRVTWSGWQGGPGYSSFHCLVGGAASAQDFADAVRAMFNTLASHFPNEITFTFPGTVDTVDSTTGHLTTQDPVTAPSPVTGSSISTWGAPAGIVVLWNTTGFGAHGRIRGRTFFVPVIGSDFDPITGGIASSAVTAFGNAANALLAALPDFRVYGGGAGGNVIAVENATVSPRVALLRTRRS